MLEYGHRRLTGSSSDPSISGVLKRPSTSASAIAVAILIWALRARPANTPYLTVSDDSDSIDKVKEMLMTKDTKLGHRVATRSNAVDASVDRSNCPSTSNSRRSPLDNALAGNLRSCPDSWRRSLLLPRSSNQTHIRRPNQSQTPVSPLSRNLLPTILMYYFPQRLRRLAPTLCPERIARCHYQRLRWLYEVRLAFGRRPELRPLYSRPSPSGSWPQRLLHYVRPAHSRTRTMLEPRIARQFRHPSCVMK